MTIEKNEDGGLVFRDMDPLLTTLLRQIPGAANPGGHEGALDRLYCDPVSPEDPNAEEMTEEWNEYVQPEIRELFQSAIETVVDDLAKMEETQVELDGDKYAFSTLNIPPQHLLAWVNGLNQARIVLACRHGFEEQDMNRVSDTPFESAREFALWQVNLYGDLQHELVRVLDGDDYSEFDDDIPQLD